MSADPAVTPLAGGLPYRVVRRVLAGVPCLLELPPEGEGLRAVCVVLHGAYNCKEGKLGIYSALAAKGVAVLLPDAALHGERQQATPPNLNAREYVWESVYRTVQEMPLVLNDFETEFGKLPVWVIGSSMGGYVALTLARTEKRVQKAAALITSGVWAEPQVQVPHLIRFLNEHRPITHAAEFPPLPLLLASGDSDEVFPLARHHEVTAEALREAYAQAGAEGLFREQLFPTVGHYTSRMMRDATLRFLLAE